MRCLGIRIPRHGGGKRKSVADVVETLVRKENLSEPGVWWGELGGTGTKGMKTFGRSAGTEHQLGKALRKAGTHVDHTYILE